MIQIDDAGWGALVGGMLVGVARVTPGQPTQFAYRVIEPSYFQDDAYAHKAYLDQAARRAAECFDDLDVDLVEPVVCCTGYALERVRAWLHDAGYIWQPGKIENPLQDLLEGALHLYLDSLGFVVDFETLTSPGKKGLLWWKQIQWLKGGNVNARRALVERAKFCKTGWASYSIWANYPYEEAKQLNAQRKRREDR